LDLHLIIGRLNIHLRGPSCEEAGNRTSQPPTTAQHHDVLLMESILLMQQQRDKAVQQRWM